MAGYGTTTIDFGSYPGGGSASVAVTGQTQISASSVVEAWVYPTATADHSADEHWVDPPRVVAGNVVAGSGFTIYGTSRANDKFQDQYTFNEAGRYAERASGVIETEDNPYGLWTVAWTWI